MQMRKGKPEVSYDFTPGTEKVRVGKTKLIAPKVGIYNGSFDPVHAGHLVFALKAQKLAELDHIYFMPERKPDHNAEAEHYVHRSAMVKRALRPYQQFSLLDLPDAKFSARSLPRLQMFVPGADVCLLTSAAQLLWEHSEWPKIYEQMQLIVAVTSEHQLAEFLERVTGSKLHFRNLTFVDIGTNHISSADIRTGLRSGKQVRGVLPSVWRYAQKQWLYITPGHHV